MDLRLLVESFETFAASAGPVAVAALWQGVVVASSLAICLRLVPRVSAAHRFILWAAGFGVLVSLPLLPQLSTVAHAGLGSSVSAAAGASTRPWLEFDLRWSLAIGALWIVGSVIRAADLAIHTFRLRRLWKSAVPVESRTLGRRKAQVCTTKELDRPGVIGFFSPRIFIPEWLFRRLTPGELDQIVLHEAEHLRRGDDWTNLVQKLCLVLFPLNPALWWIERQLCTQREMACDEGVIKITHAPRSYAACLTSLAERGLERRTAALSLGAWQRRPELVQRVHSILRRKRAMHPVASGALLAALGGSLLAASVELARCPQLIAFVPSANTASKALKSDGWQDEPARLVDASLPVSRRAAGKPAFYAIQAKAVMPMPEGPKARVARATKPSEPTKAALHSQDLNAKMIAAKAKPADEQQLIVFTSFEQVETASAPDAQASDYDSTQGPSSSAKFQSDNQETEHITVTRLIFKVVPTGSNSPQPTAVHLRNGWFVIQL